MAAFSPIPLAFLGFDQTRQIGLGYLKSFGAVCIAGLIILILLISFPVILGGIVAVNPGTGTPIDAIANGLTYALQYLAMCILLVLLIWEYMRIRMALSHEKTATAEMPRPMRPSEARAKASRRGHFQS